MEVRDKEDHDRTVIRKVERDLCVMSYPRIFPQLKTMTDVAVYPPNSPDATKLAFGLEKFMGKWYATSKSKINSLTIRRHVTHSTLPLWKVRNSAYIRV